MRIENLTDCANIRSRSRERSRDIVKAHLAAELNVASVLVGDKGHREIGARNVHALVVRDLAAVLDRAVNFGAVHLVDAEADQTVVNQNDAALLHIARQLLIAHGDNRVVAEQLSRGQRELCALLKHFRAVLEVAETNLRALGVEQGCDRETQLSAELHHALEFLGMRLVRVMRKVKTCHIHAREHELLQHLLAVTGRSNRADNLCLSQNSLL